MRAALLALFFGLGGCGEVPTEPSAPTPVANGPEAEGAPPQGVPNSVGSPFSMAVEHAVFDPCEAASCGQASIDPRSEHEMEPPEQEFFRLEAEALQEKHHLKESP